MNRRPDKTLLVAPELYGRAYTTAHTEAADQWFSELFNESVSNPDGVALLAVGGYGRGALWPKSDLDVILVHRKRPDIGQIAESLWYPVWDRGLKLGHTVATVREAVGLASAELERATAFLDARLIAGDEALAAAFDKGIAALWHRETDEWLRRLDKSVNDRHRTAGDVAFMIEPDLKLGRGGLRDIQALRWAGRAQPGFADDLLELVADEADFLLGVRVELHRHTGRSTDVLALDDQDAVAAAARERDGAALMSRVALAGRSVAWNSDEAWDRWRRSGTKRKRRSAVVLDDWFEVVDDHIELRRDVDVSEDPLLLLRVADLAANRDMTIGRRTLQLLTQNATEMPVPWPAEARQLFAGLFLAGAPSIDVVEDLDHFGLMSRLLPEWKAVRCKPQRNVLHTYTVDRHLCEAAANAVQLVDRVSRPDLLVVGALLHDIGKGFPGDHTEVGMELIQDIGTRMGYPPTDVAILVDLCRYHLLLPDVATRRDLSDGGTLRAVAAAVDSVDFLHMLAALTEADSKATGPATWGDWRAHLLAELVGRTEQVLKGGSIEDSSPEFPGDSVRALMGERRIAIEAEGNTLTVVAPDAPLLFSRIAGVVAVNGLDVLDASAYSDDEGMAANQLIVQSSTGAPVEWQGVVAMVEQAVLGRLALRARLAERARTYARYQRRLSALPPKREVIIDNDLSDVATVIDVYAHDTIGLLYRVTQALGEFWVDIRSARVQTLGPQAVDSFYICDREGAKLTDPVVLSELRLALTEAMEDPS